MTPEKEKFVRMTIRIPKPLHNRFVNYINSKDDIVTDSEGIRRLINIGLSKEGFDAEVGEGSS